MPDIFIFFLGLICFILAACGIILNMGAEKKKVNKNLILYLNLRSQRPRNHASIEFFQ